MTTENGSNFKALLLSYGNFEKNVKDKQENLPRDMNIVTLFLCAALEVVQRRSWSINHRR